MDLAGASPNKPMVQAWAFSLTRGHSSPQGGFPSAKFLHGNVSRIGLSIFAWEMTMVVPTGAKRGRTTGIGVGNYPNTSVRMLSEEGDMLPFP